MQAAKSFINLISSDDLHAFQSLVLGTLSTNAIIVLSTMLSVFDSISEEERRFVNAIHSPSRETIVSIENLMRKFRSRPANLISAMLNFVEISTCPFVYLNSEYNQGSIEYDDAEDIMLSMSVSLKNRKIKQFLFEEKMQNQFLQVMSLESRLGISADSNSGIPIILRSLCLLARTMVNSFSISRENRRFSHLQTVGAASIRHINTKLKWMNSICKMTQTPRELIPFQEISVCRAVRNKISREIIEEILKDLINARDALYLGSHENDTTKQVRNDIIVDLPTLTRKLFWISSRKCSNRSLLWDLMSPGDEDILFTLLKLIDSDARAAHIYSSSIWLCEDIVAMEHFICKKMTDGFTIHSQSDNYPIISSSQQLICCLSR